VKGTVQMMKRRSRWPAEQKIELQFELATLANFRVCRRQKSKSLWCQNVDLTSSKVLLYLLDPLANPLLDLLCVRWLVLRPRTLRRFIVVMCLMFGFSRSVDLTVYIISTCSRLGWLRLAIVVRRVSPERRTCRCWCWRLSGGQVVGILRMYVLQWFMRLVID
jgi:hypothetical protein